MKRAGMRMPGLLQSDDMSGSVLRRRIEWQALSRIEWHW
jgi:hypothetical protein